jgi:hypothetical protein
VCPSVLKHPLQRHPASAAPPGIAVAVRRLPADEPRRPLRLRYEVAGDAASLRWPAPLGAAPPAPEDGLWRGTCFEAFLAAPEAAGTGYVEYNFAPSGAWACYRFDGYRAGMRPQPCAVPPRIAVFPEAGATVVEVAAPWPAPDPAPYEVPAPTRAMSPGTAGFRPGGPADAPRRVRLGLTAVLQAADGSLSYWALRHPSAQPDFHNADGFQLEVEVPG